MTHFMKLNPGPFDLIDKGYKTIELRLFDEKRQKISVGDLIIFSHKINPEKTITVLVTALHCFSDFAALYAALPLDQCGYLPNELETASPEDMLAYYSAQEQERYGVVGIAFCRVNK